MPKWTVMVFMGADTIDGSLPLDEAVEHDLREIGYIGGAATLEVFVEVHRSRGPVERHRYYFEKGKPQESSETVARAATEMALPIFISDSLRTANHSPDTDSSLLILWGHAYNFAFGRSRTRSGVVDALDFSELSGILGKLQAKAAMEMGGGPGYPAQKVDVVGFDACEVATVEIACELEPYAKYLLGSQVGIPIPGWPYDRILDRLAKPQGRLMAPAELGSYAVRRFCESYAALDPTSLTMIDLSRAAELKVHTSLLTLTLLAAIGDSAKRNRIVELFYRSQTAEGRAFVDVADLCLNLMRESGDLLVSEAARALGDFLAVSKPLELIGESEKGTGRPIIIEHGRNAGELARLHGISLYAPHVAPDDETAETRALYESFAFPEESRWNTLLRLLA